MAKRKITACSARMQLPSVDFTQDFHALSHSAVDDLVAMAKKYGYRKRKDAPGSTARMFFYHLARARCRTHR